MQSECTPHSSNIYLVPVSHLKTGIRGLINIIISLHHKKYLIITIIGLIINYLITTITRLITHHTTTTVLRPFFRDHLGEMVPEENFWTLWCKGRLTQVETLTIQLGATNYGHFGPKTLRPLDTSALVWWVRTVRTDRHWCRSVLKTVWT